MTTFFLQKQFTLMFFNNLKNYLVIIFVIEHKKNIKTLILFLLQYLF